MGVTKWLKARIEASIDKKLGPDFTSRSKALVVRQNEFGFDPFGFDKSSIKYVMLLAKWLHRSYFRTEVFGIENLPAAGRAILVSNHSGQLPFDGVVLNCTCFLDATPPRVARSMFEHFVPSVPFASYLFNRWGQITGTPDNCRRLLEQEELVLAFPEGARGISKPFSKRYQLQDFGLGFMRLAIQSNAPIIPVAVIGAEEQAPAYNVKLLAKLVGTPAFPVVPYPPFLPLLPLPVRYRVYFGPPLTFGGDHDEDDETLGEKVAVVKQTIQTMLDKGVRERKNVFW